MKNIQVMPNISIGIKSSLDMVKDARLICDEQVTVFAKFA